MKITFKATEVKAMEKLMVRIGLEAHKVTEILSDIKDKQVVEFNADDYKIFNENMINEVNGAVCFMTITLIDDEYTIKIDDEFICDYIQIYESTIVEILTGIQNIAKSIYFIYQRQIKSFVNKWFTKPEIDKPMETSEELEEI